MIKAFKILQKALKIWQEAFENFLYPFLLMKYSSLDFNLAFFFIG